MVDKKSPPWSQDQSAKDCGCDPAANHVCALHSKDKRCILGHWERYDNCPACQVIKEDEEK